MAPASNLPQPLTTFFGREEELRAVEEALRADRLVTLVGPGGVGKTRLAIEAARAAEGRFGGSAWFVDLSAVSDGETVPTAIRAALGAAEAQGPPISGIIDLIGDRETLLILDNCEQIVESVAGSVDELLRQCPGLRVLATSRERLSVTGEQVWRVAPLGVPPSDGASTAADLSRMPAVRLFVDRARLANAAFELTNENAGAVARIVATIDGLPLATELAAARVRALPVEQVAERLGERLTMLTGGARTAPERQRTMEAAVRWSYELLTAPERVLFGRLAVFAGGWTLEAAEGVCAFGDVSQEDVLGLLESLVDRSLVVAPPEQGRFHFLEVILEFARREMVESGEADEVGSRHCHWYERLAARAEPEWLGPGHAFWVERLTREQENLTAALDWASHHPDDRGAGLELIGNLHWFWMQGASSEEVRKWIGRLLDAPGPASPRASAKALVVATWFSAGDAQEAEDYAERAVALAREVGDEGLLADALDAVARGGLVNMDAVRMRDAGLEAARLAQKSGNWRAEVRALTHVAIAEDEDGNSPAARPYLERALEVAVRAGSSDLQALSLSGLGENARMQKNLREAESLYSRALEAATTVGEGRLMLMTRFNLAMTLVQLGSRSDAAGLLRDSLELAIRLGEQLFIADCVRGLAAVEAAEGDSGLAARLLGAADGWNADSTQAADRPVVEAAFNMARRKLGAAFEGEYEAGTRWPLLSAAREMLKARASTAGASQKTSGLSPRETEILRLVAGGESNQAIADRLVLSRRTVENHIANVYSKIGAANRVEATRFALDHDLLPGALA